MNVEKINYAIKNSKSDKRNELMNAVYRVNSIAEEIWLESQTDNVHTQNGGHTQNGDHTQNGGHTQIGGHTQNGGRLLNGGHTENGNRTQNGDHTQNGAEKTRIVLYEVLCHQRSTKNYYDDNGFTYTKKNEGDTMYLRCKNIHSGCKASVICKGKDLQQAILSIPHSHVAIEKEKDNLLFNKMLERIIFDNPFKQLMDVYTEAKDALDGQINRTHIGEFSSYSVYMHRKKKQFIPLLPQTIIQFEELINNVKYRQEFMFNKDKLFYHGIWRGPSSNNVAFISQRILEEIKKQKNISLIMDGTFKVLPRHLKFRQLYIISAILEGRCYPFAYILMEKRDTSSYKVVFEELQYLMPDVTVSNCMTDYEAATRKAIRAVFPRSILSGCYFHYVQAIVKKFKRFGLINDVKFETALQEVSALALLPNELVIEGFRTISKNFKKSLRWKRFSDYWMRTWSKANISVYGLEHRTNNFAESLNKTINTIIKSRHPNIWMLIKNLKIVDSMRFDELNKVGLGHMPEIKENKSKFGVRKFRNLNKKIKKATKFLDKTGSVEGFLKKVTFNENLSSYFVNIDIEKENEYDDDSGDEEFIANDFDQRSNFRRQFPRTVTVTKRKANPFDCEPQKKQKRN